MRSLLAVLPLRVNRVRDFLEVARAASTLGVMSYVAVPRQNYETYVPDGPWENGAPGWSTAPFPGWGMNPNQALPVRLATAGIGTSCACSQKGVGADPLPVWPIPVVFGLFALGAWGVIKFAEWAEQR